MERAYSASVTHRMMTVEQDTSNNKIGRLLKSDCSANEVRKLRLHYVRIHEVKDKLKVQIDFGRNITFTFDDGKHLCGKQNMGPLIYTRNLELMMADDAQF